MVFFIMQGMSFKPNDPANKPTPQTERSRLIDEISAQTGLSTNWLAKPLKDFFSNGVMDLQRLTSSQQNSLQSFFLDQFGLVTSLKGGKLSLKWGGREYAKLSDEGKQKTLTDLAGKLDGWYAKNAPAAPKSEDLITSAPSVDKKVDKAIIQDDRAINQNVKPAQTQNSVLVLDARLQDHVDAMRSKLTGLAFFNPNDLGATYALMKDVGTLNSALETKLIQLFTTDQALIQTQRKAFWASVMEGAPANSFVAKAFANGYVAGTSDAAVLNAFTGITLIRQLDGLLKDALGGRISPSTISTAVNDAASLGSIDPINAGTIISALESKNPANDKQLKIALDDAVASGLLLPGQASLLQAKILTLNSGDTQIKVNISQQLNQLINTNSLDYAASVLYGPDGEALDAFLKSHNLSLYDDKGVLKSAGEKYIESVMLISDRLVELRNQTAQFASLYNSSYTLLATDRTGFNISDEAWNAMQKPLSAKPLDRPTFDAFTLLSFVAASDTPEFHARIPDAYLYKTARLLVDLPPSGALLVAERPEILTNLRKNIENESVALSLMDVGLRDLRSIYAGKFGFDVRFMAMKEYADGWISLTADADLLSHVKSEAIRGTEYGQIEVADPRLELHQTYGRTDMSFSLDVFSHWRLGGLVFRDLPVYERFGTPYGDDLRTMGDYNQREQDRFFKSRPYVYIADAFWAPPSLSLRMDYNSYNDALYAMMQKLRDKYTKSESIRVSSVGINLQGSGTPGREDLDVGARLRGREWGQTAFGGYSNRESTTYDKDKQVVADNSSTHAQVSGSNLALDGSRLYNAFYDWVNNQTKSQATIGANNITLERVSDALYGSADAELYGVNILISTAHYSNLNQTAESTGERNVSTQNEDHEVFLRCTDGWYRVKFNSRQRNDFIDFLNGSGAQVDSDGYLRHLYQEASNKTADPVRVNAGLETYQEHDKLVGYSTDGDVNGMFVAVKFPTPGLDDGQSVVLGARTIEKEGIGALAQMFGPREKATVVSLDVSNVRRPIQQLFFGPNGYYTSYYGLGPRSYTFGEQQTRDKRAGEDLVLVNFAWLALEQYRVQAFGGGSKSGEFGMAGGSFSDHGLGVGAYYIYRTPTGNIRDSQPAEVFLGFGQTGNVFSWPASTVGSYDRSEIGGNTAENANLTTSIQLDKNTTLYGNLFINKNSLAALSSSRILGSIQSQVTQLGDDIKASQNLFDTDYNAGIALRQDWAQRLFGIHNMMESFVVGDDYRSGILQYSLGLKKKDGTTTQIGFANTRDGGLFSFIYAPNNNLTFFTSLPTGHENSVGNMGGVKYADDQFGVAGLYHEVDKRSYGALQLSLKDAGGFQLQGGHQYARTSLLIGDVRTNILFDAGMMGEAGKEFVGYGATYNSRAATNLDISLGLTREYLKGTTFNATGITGSVFYTPPRGTQLEFGGNYLWVLGERWWYAHIGVRF